MLYPVQSVSHMAMILTRLLVKLLGEISNPTCISNSHTAMTMVDESSVVYQQLRVFLLLHHLGVVYSYYNEN